MRPAEALPDGLPPALDVLAGPQAGPRQTGKPASGSRSAEGRRAASPVRVWPRPVVQEDLEHLRRRHRTLHGRRKPRWLRWLRALRWTGVIAGSPVVAVLWVLTSPRFALREVKVTLDDLREVPAAAAPSGEPHVSEAWVRETVAPFVGDNLLRLSLADVARELERHPWVKTTSVSKELPERLTVRIHERREVALLRDGDALYYLDQDGRRIVPLPATPQPETPEPETPDREGSEGRGLPGPRPADLPIFRVVGEDADAEPAAGIELLRELEEVRPEWLGGLTEIEILGQGDFKLWTADLPFPLLVRAGTLRDKARRLQELLPELSARYGAEAAVDLRFDRRIIIQPSAGGAPAGNAPSRGAAGAASGESS